MKICQQTDNWDSNRIPSLIKIWILDANYVHEEMLRKWDKHLFSEGYVKIA